MRRWYVLHAHPKTATHAPRDNLQLAGVAVARRATATTSPTSRVTTSTAALAARRVVTRMPRRAATNPSVLSVAILVATRVVSAPSGKHAKITRHGSGIHVMMRQRPADDCRTRKLVAIISAVAKPSHGLAANYRSPTGHSARCVVEASPDAPSPSLLMDHTADKQAVAEAGGQMRTSIPNVLLGPEPTIDPQMDKVGVPRKSVAHRLPMRRLETGVARQRNADLRARERMIVPLSIAQLHVRQLSLVTRRCRPSHSASRSFSPVPASPRGATSKG